MNFDVDLEFLLSEVACRVYAAKKSGDGRFDLVVSDFGAVRLHTPFDMPLLGWLCSIESSFVEGRKGRSEKECVALRDSILKFFEFPYTCDDVSRLLDEKLRERYFEIYQV